jgi:hypothetical protein
MERSVWTDERLDDLIEGMRSGFGRLDHDVRDLRAEIAELRSTVIRANLTLSVGMIVGFLGVIATILVGA